MTEQMKTEHGDRRMTPWASFKNLQLNQRLQYCENAVLIAKGNKAQTCRDLGIVINALNRELERGILPTTTQEND